MAIHDVSERPLNTVISLKGRVAVVTGGAAGIGRATARRLAEAGATVAVADLDERAAQDAANSLPGDGHQALHIDVRDSASVASVAANVAKRLDGLHIWVNNAGVYPVCPTLEMSDAEWERVIGINLSGSFFGAREAARQMVSRGSSGVIVNTQSTTVHKVPAPGLAHYIASKGGVESMTRALALEFGPHNIRVLSVAPTLTRTEGTLAHKPQLEAAMGNVGDAHELYGSRLPLGRIARPDDIARVVLFCASDLSLMMTGSVLSVDGGDLIC